MGAEEPVGLTPGWADPRLSENPAPSSEPCGAPPHQHPMKLLPALSQHPPEMIPIVCQACGLLDRGKEVCSPPPVGTRRGSLERSSQLPAWGILREVGRSAGWQQSVCGDGRGCSFSEGLRLRPVSPLGCESWDPAGGGENRNAVRPGTPTPLPSRAPFSSLAEPAPHHLKIPSSLPASSLILILLLQEGQRTLVPRTPVSGAFLLHRC